MGGGGGKIGSLAGFAGFEALDDTLKGTASLAVIHFDGLHLRRVNLGILSSYRG